MRMTAYPLTGIDGAIKFPTLRRLKRLRLRRLFYGRAAKRGGPYSVWGKVFGNSMDGWPRTATPTGTLYECNCNIRMFGGKGLEGEPSGFPF